MTKEFLYAKIHSATVTDANLHYAGSITIDAKLLEEAKLQEHQKVDVVNVNNGERFHTYIIKGEYGNGEICLNGAAARKVEKGDKVIIIAYAMMSDEEIAQHSPHIVIVDNDNQPIKRGI